MTTSKPLTDPTAGHHFEVQADWLSKSPSQPRSYSRRWKGSEWFFLEGMLLLSSAPLASGTDGFRSHEHPRFLRSLTSCKQMESFS